EPTGNLDSRTGHGILEARKELNAEGQTIVMVTHDERIAAQAGRIIRLADGKVKES
ncbi:MAG: macrolide ABC transporter ATP-binding protein, partial [Planctomycetes bacterium]|nr:macrolide ABC transporter ATP-binding protein [Planctomycetota bacterium]